MAEKYTPSKIKQIIEGRKFRRMEEMVKSPDFPRELMLKTLNEETPRFSKSTAWGVDLNHSELMSEMLNSARFTDKEVELMVQNNPSLRGLSLYCERLAKEHYLYAFELRIAEKSFTNVSMWKVVRHKHFPMENAMELVNTTENSELIKVIAEYTTSADVLEAIFKRALTLSTDESNTIVTQLAGNKHLPRHIVDKLLVLDLKALNVDQIGELCRNLLNTFPHTFEQGMFVRGEVVKTVQTNMKYTLSFCDEGIMKNASITKDQALTMIDRVACSRSWEHLLKRIDFTQDELEEMLLTNASSNTGLCYAIMSATDSISDSAIIEFVENNSDSTMVGAMLASHSVPTTVLETLAYDPDPVIQRLIAVHPDVPEHTYRSLYRVRMEMQASKSFYTFQQSEAFSGINKLQKFELLHEEYGFDLFDFKFVTSPKKALQMIIGSKHPQEVSFVYGSGTAESIMAISSLQSVFTNEKGKLDRFRYLSFVAEINDALGDGDDAGKRVGLAVDSVSLKLAMSFFTNEEIIQVLLGNNSDEAQDVFRLLASLINRGDENENAKQVKLVRRWIEKNNNLGDAFHTYLSNKQLRDLGSSQPNVQFYQARAIAELKSINEMLPTGVRLTLPANSVELRSLGRKQRHCVGTKHYADRCVDGSSIIFALSTGVRSDETFTYQFERYSNRLNQAKGFANSSTPPALEPVAREVFKTIKSTCERIAAIEVDTKDAIAA